MVLDVLLMHEACPVRFRNLTAAEPYILHPWIESRSAGWAEWQPLAIRSSRTQALPAGCSIIDPHAVADVEFSGCAEPPECVLDEAREGRWEGGVDDARVDPLCQRLDDVGTPATGVAGRAIGMLGSASSQDAGAVEEGVNQRVDGDHAGAGRHPMRSIGVASQQQVGQGHRPQLRADPMNGRQGLDHGLSRPGGGVGSGGARISPGEPPV